MGSAPDNRQSFKIIIVGFGLLFSLFSGQSQAAGSSANFKITSDIIDVGGASSSSASFKLLGKLRQHQLSPPSSTNFIIGEGFLRSVYSVIPKPVALAPIVTSITPNKGTNTGLVNITDLAGANFQTGATIKLSKSGETGITATNVVVTNANKITCTFDITGKTVGLWDITVTNLDGKQGALPFAFKIEAPTVGIVGPVVSTQNPYNPSLGATSIKYTLTKDTDITVTIFNIRGEKTWERAYPAGQAGATAGANEILWNGITDFQSTASFGVYIAIVTTKQNGSVVELGRTKIAVVK